jgi:hypothetical protein
VDVDKAGRDHPALGLDLVARVLGNLADRDDSTSRDRNIGLERLDPRTVDDQPAPDDQIDFVRHGRNSF